MSMSEIEAGDEVVQVHGPCVGKIFVVDEVDGNLLHVRLKDPKPPYNGQPGWSHRGNYLPAATTPPAPVWIPGVGWSVSG